MKEQIIKFVLTTVIFWEKIRNYSFSHFCGGGGGVCLKIYLKYIYFHCRFFREENK